MERNSRCTLEQCGPTCLIVLKVSNDSQRFSCGLNVCDVGVGETGREVVRSVSFPMVLVNVLIELPLPPMLSYVMVIPTDTSFDVNSKNSSD